MTICFLENLMKRLTVAIFFLIANLAIIISSDVYAGKSIDLWVRKAGDYVDGADPGKLNLQNIRFEQLSTKSLRTFDIQYEKELMYKGVYLAEIIKGYRRNKDTDMALLHFQNGMIIPIDHKSDSANIFLAFKYKSGKKWKSDFPNLEKKDAIYYRKDPNPTRFTGNKIVYFQPQEKFYIKDSKGRKIKLFSPWAHCNSLTGIEFIDKRAYFRQFHISNKKEIVAGLEVFKKRCQFCHGVRQVGARFGWDYSNPLRLSKKRNNKNLHLFVKYPKASAFNQGLKMPNQLDISVEETDNLWKWIDHISSKKPKPYIP